MIGKFLLGPGTKSVGPMAGVSGKSTFGGGGGGGGLLGPNVPEKPTVPIVLLPTSERRPTTVGPFVGMANLLSGKDTFGGLGGFCFVVSVVHAEGNIGETGAFGTLEDSALNWLLLSKPGELGGTNVEPITPGISIPLIVEACMILSTVEPWPMGPAPVVSRPALRSRLRPRKLFNRNLFSSLTLFVKSGGSWHSTPDISSTPEKG